MHHPLDHCTKCIVYFLIEDSLAGRGKSMIPSVASLLAELYPKRGAREWLPMLTIIYMAPGGHRQWPMSIALLERLSWLALQTRSLALSYFQAAVQKNPTVVDQRLQRLHQLPSSSLILGPKWDATTLGSTFLQGMIRITSSILDLLEMESRLPTHAVIHERAAKWLQDDEFGV